VLLLRSFLPSGKAPFPAGSGGFSIAYLWEASEWSYALGNIQIFGMEGCRFIR
jgi:hypothetical protein